MWIKLTADDPCTMYTKEQHGNGPWRATKLFNDHWMHDVLENFPLAYQSPLPIKKEKKEDLMKMCPYIPMEYREYYLNIL